MGVGRDDSLLLKLGINLGLGRLGEPLLVLKVAVPKVVAVAPLDKVPAERLVGGLGASVRGPGEVGWVFLLAVGNEGVEAVGEHACVGCFFLLG